MTPITYETLDQWAVAQNRDAIVAVYASVFTEPPYFDTPEQIATFGDDLLSHASLPGFRCVVACHGQELVGFEYAITMEGSRWFRRAAAPPPDFLAGVDRCFILEWAVLQAWRGRGIGEELMRRVLTDRPERYAVLPARPHAPAMAVYRRAGWQKAGDSYPTPENPRPHMEIMYLPLP
ncbi:GNAT family N-acetyltransferase [Catellatospora sp. KI3]|uniref:GNAT family N-acetyltransferase n=1 Tax=Catellatospora sp. KI3 TaxID=3041620 RepID=UPI0024830582|nr:GNAT family N-acetyltransferase [Catellatospora sp. KI3]MDI1463357.1 GNAT family N-acetyltransferase [Catellatospora sp. KI3]